MDEHEIDYKEYDVSSDDKRRKEMIEESGQMGVPVLMLGEEMMIGFDEGRFEEMVEKHKEASD